jgi:hypothetical protein
MSPEFYSDHLIEQTKLDFGSHFRRKLSDESYPRQISNLIIWRAVGSKFKRQKCEAALSAGRVVTDYIISIR